MVTLLRPGNYKHTQCVLELIVPSNLTGFGHDVVKLFILLHCAVVLLYYRVISFIMLNCWLLLLASFKLKMQAMAVLNEHMKELKSQPSRCTSRSERGMMGKALVKWNTFPCQDSTCSRRVLA